MRKVSTLVKCCSCCPTHQTPYISHFAYLKVFGRKRGEREIQISRIAVVGRIHRHGVHQARNEVRRERNDERRRRRTDAAQDRHDVEPDANVLDATRHRPPIVLEELLRVQAHLENVVEQRKQRRQRKSDHENGDEPELND